MVRSRFVGILTAIVASFLCIPQASAEMGESPRSLEACTRLDYYTTEADGQIVLQVPDTLADAALSVQLLRKRHHILTGYPVDERRPALIPFPLGALREGKTVLTCRLVADGSIWAETKVPVVKRRPKANAVKVDRLTGALMVDDLPFFPFGFYCYSPVQPTLAVEEIVKGFNMMSPYQPNDPESLPERRKYMDRCAKLGMKVHYQLLSIAGGGGVYSADAKEAAQKRALLEAEVKAFRDHPALLAWYIADEPTGSNVSPKRLAKTRAAIKELDPYHPVTVVFMAPKAARLYADSMDVVMTDIYPIPHAPPAKTGEAVALLAREFAFEKPVWFVPQAFGGHEWWRREPTAQEERIMTYLPVIHGATGIQYFIRHGMNGFPKSTSTWAECGRLALELAELAPALFSEEPRPEVTCSPATVEAAAWQDRGMVTVLAANTQNVPVTMRIAFENDSLAGDAAVLFENRGIAVVNGVIEDMIDAYGTRAYQISVGPPPEEDLDVSPNNRVLNPSFEENPSVGTPAGCYANVGGGHGVTYFVDPRVARHGRHSLRVHTPAKGQGCDLSFFPFELKQNESFRISVWAKGKPLPKPPQMKRVLGFFDRLFGPRREREAPPRFTLTFTGGLDEAFTLTPEWREYGLSGTAGQDHRRASVHLAFGDPGTAWFDLLQVIVEPGKALE